MAMYRSPGCAYACIPPNVGGRDCLLCRSALVLSLSIGSERKAKGD